MKDDSPVFRTPKPWTERYDTHVVNQWVSENRFASLPAEKVELPSFVSSRSLLPVPFWANHETVIDCYWRAWELAFGNLKLTTPENGFCSNYCDTAFNGNLFMWDSSFVTCFGVYGRRAFDYQHTLDNFYRKQHTDGFICREISEEDGQDTYQRFDPSSTGPNVLAWAEWNYYRKTGDAKRLEMVFPVLVAFHQWMRTYRTWPDGSYWTTGWGCGMDNLPRVGPGEHINWSHGNRTWVDATLQALLSARVLWQMAAVLGRQAEVQDLQDEIPALTNYCNRNLWDEKTGFYYDCLPSGELAGVKHIGAYWSLLAGCVPPERVANFLAHLDNPDEFKRAHRVPALSADDPHFSSTGDYWCGGIWAPTNYMVLKGLETVGRDELAYEIAANHLESVVRVFAADDIHWDGADQFREYFHLTDFTYDDQHTLWENYAPDVIKPGSHSKPGYVGWTGLPPVAVLLEDVFGLSPDAGSNRLTWRVHLTEEHGVRNYPFGMDGSLDLKCHSRRSKRERPSIEVHSDLPLILDLIWDEGKETIKVEKESTLRRDTEGG